MFSLMGNCISCIKQRRQPKRDVTLAILGLDSAGKTTTTKALKGETLETAPTIGFNREEVNFKNYHMVLYDLGGGKRIRDIWKNYLSEVYGVIYVVDSSDRQRIDETKENLRLLLEHQQVKEKPLLVLANKQDIPNAMDEVDLCEKLSLEAVVNANKCPCKMETCSAIKGTGRRIDTNIKHGMSWLCTMLDKLYDSLHSRVEEDVAVAEKIRKEENAARKERVRKAKEEREKKEEEERKKLGIEKEEEPEEEEDFTDGPWKRLDADEIKRKEERYKKQKEKEKERQRKLKELEKSETTQTKTDLDKHDDDDMLRAPRSSRSLQSYGLSNGSVLKPIGGWSSHRSEEEEDDSEGLVPSSRLSRQQLPPLQQPLGTRFMENKNTSAITDKQREAKKKKSKVEEVHDNPNFETTNYSHLSVSRIQVEAKNGFEDISDNENEEQLSKRSNGSKNNYFDRDDREMQQNSGRRKTGKKKAVSGSYDDEEGFDTLRLSQHLEDEDTIQERLENRPPAQKQGRILLRKIEGADYREEERADTPVKKLKRKKKNRFRKNNIAPSDDEHELSDIQTTPKKEIPWVRSQSPQKMLDDVANHTNQWGLAEDLAVPDGHKVGYSRRRGPNAESEDELIL